MPVVSEGIFRGLVVSKELEETLLIARMERGHNAARYEIFLRCYSSNGNITRSAKMAGLKPGTVRSRTKSDPVFKERVEEAKLQSIDILIGEVRRRGFEGVENDIFYRGQKVGTEIKYSDALLTLLLKALDPRFRDSIAVSSEVKHSLAEDAVKSVVDSVYGAPIDITPEQKVITHANPVPK